MKTSIPSSKAWALNQLEIDSEENITPSLLRYIQSEDFLLNDLEIEALNILTENEVDNSTESYNDFCSKKLSGEIKAFRKGFFTYSIQDRRARLNELSDQSQSSLSCKAMLSELRLGLFIDSSMFPENNKALDIILRFFTENPGERSAILDELIEKTKEEKEHLFKEYGKLSDLDEDLHRLCPQLENIINPQEPILEKEKKKKSGNSLIFWLSFLIVYLLIKLGCSSIKSSQTDEVNEILEELRQEKIEQKEKTSKEEKDEFLEYLENEEKNPEKLNE